MHKIDISENRISSKLLLIYKVFPFLLYKNLFTLIVCNTTLVCVSSTS